MFGLLRTIFLVFVAFLIGLMFERSQAAEACAKEGGAMVDGICRGVDR